MTLPIIMDESLTGTQKRIKEGTVAEAAQGDKR